MAAGEVKLHATEKNYAGIDTHYTLASRVLWYHNGRCLGGWYIGYPGAKGNFGGWAGTGSLSPVLAIPVYVTSAGQATENGDKVSTGDNTELDGG